MTCVHVVLVRNLKTVTVNDVKNDYFSGGCLVKSEFSLGVRLLYKEMNNGIYREKP